MFSPNARAHTFHHLLAPSRVALASAITLAVTLTEPLGAQPAGRDSTRTVRRVASTQAALPADSVAHGDGKDRAPIAQATTSAGAPAITVATGFGTMAVGGEVQVWYVDGHGVPDHTFRLRRADLRLTGSSGQRVSWLLQLDAAKALSVNSAYTDIDGQRTLASTSVNQASRMLQDAAITVRATKTVTFTAGQFLLPFSHEGSRAVAKYETVEQAMFVSDRARGGGVAAVRDVGLLAAGALGARVRYQLGVFNSSGDQQGTADRDAQKAILTRLLVQAGRGVSLGMSSVYGGAPSADRARRDRFAVDAHYLRGPLTVRSEVVTAVDGLVHRAGGYVHTAVALTSATEVSARFDQWDPDRAREDTQASVIARELLVGITRSLEQGALKLQVNLTHRQYRHGLLPTRDGVNVLLQAAW